MTIRNMHDNMHVGWVQADSILQITIGQLAAEVLALAPAGMLAGFSVHFAVHA